jgi:hypothetical protein
MPRPKKPKAKLELFNQPRREWLRAQLDDLIGQHQSGNIHSSVLLERLLVALRSALEDDPPSPAVGQ